ncbi:hypothetical protein P1X14_15265 [Sphingomonas sp. AOB5]|uniref:hypothetical protein n=1 Tax=Sphingomonas sp. AOB5 TaxID=3034017 RepID=UPI0023F71B0D|nr:hypothetical protein [Sphingomonas sp. AOB5]MDF7776615.1 hypothetical protein [Sphingomonas sp. AOB5]
MTSGDLIDLFLATLLRNHGGQRHRWRTVLGEVKLYSVETHGHCNWSITPIGSAGQIEAVERIADRLRIEHPIVAPA